jgi:hypothetical protein
MKEVLTAAVVSPKSNIALNTITDWFVCLIAGFHCCVNEIGAVGFIPSVEYIFLQTFRDNL